MRQPRDRRFPLGTRLRTLMSRRRLDARLLEGADPDMSPELALRARQVTSLSHRRTLADSIDEIVSVAEGRGPRVSAAPPLACRGIRSARESLLELARALRERQPVEPVGVVMTERLLTDGASPLYRDSDQDSLGDTATTARAALEGHCLRPVRYGLRPAGNGFLGVREIEVLRDR